MNAKPPADASEAPSEQEGPVLYRALREVEIEQGQLVPKGQGPFLDEPRFDYARFDDATFGPSSRTATLHHQWQQRGLPTSGISTTPHLERAKFYAQRLRRVAVIPVKGLADLGIQMFRVNEVLGAEHPDLAVPQDDEHILVYPAGGPFPLQVVANILAI